MRNVAIAAAGAAVLGAICASAMTAPKPAPVAMKWELDFTFKTPQPIRATLPGSKGPETFWYLEYEVSNSTNSAQFFRPDFVLYTDTGQILESGRGVPGAVFREIKKAMNRPLLTDQANMSGPILRGANNARQSVMIFQDIDPRAGSFDIFVGGLSGETAKIHLPNPIPTIVVNRKGDNETVMVEDVVLAKTLRLSYSLPGEPAARFQTLPRLVEKEWVMR
jgi:hypothetical protein